MAKPCYLKAWSLKATGKAPEVGFRLSNKRVFIAFFMISVWT